MVKRLVLAAALLVGAALPARACPPVEPPLDFLHAAHGQVVDQSGRSVILRGVNVNGLVDYWTPSLKPPYPTGPDAYSSGRCPKDSAVTTAVPLCEKDLDQIAGLGFDVVRLPVSWSLLEPTQGHLDPVPVARIAQVVSWAAARHVRVVIDLHQDAWSKYVYAPKGTVCPPGSTAMDGGDGAPAWASVALTPACAPGGTRELEPPVQEAAQRFWDNENGLQDEYGKVVVHLARRFHDNPAVAGFELMNEPQPGFVPAVMDGTELMRFHGKVVNAVVAAVPGFRQLFFVEPAGTRNVTGARTFVLPWSTYSSYPNVVYAPHVYTGVFTADHTLLMGAAGNVQTFDADYQAAVDDAKALGLPLWVGEFGNDPDDDKAILAQHYAHQDALAVGGALWVWKEHGRWSARATASRARRIATAYPIATAGTLDSFTSDPFTGRAVITARSPQGSTSIVSLPAVFTRAPVVAGATVRLFGRRAYVTATGGAWTLRV